MDSAMEATAMAVLATATARGLPTPRLMPITAMVDTVSATPLATVLATAMAVTARGLRTLRLMPTTVMADMVDMDSVTERGPLILRPMPTTVMADMVDMDSVTVDTAMAVLATAMARGLLMPSLTTDTVELTPDTGMV